jgi:geranylgeranyl pyrophosphate synthase
MSAVASLFDDAQRRVNQLLQSRLASLPEDRLREAMSYAVLIGGKRIRPVFCYASANLFGPLNPLVDDAAMAVELIHAYSLIHDDLPAMDDDDLRRGKPTCHIAFDEATAVLAGDALQALAFEVLTGDTEPSADEAVIRLSLVRQLAVASGAQGMVIGQSYDLRAVDSSLPLADLEKMHNHKTGALIKASILMGATAARAVEPEDLCALNRYGDAVGLAFQVKDDILDVESSTETLGKRQGADEALNKPTYTSVLGLAGAKNKLAELHDRAIESLSGFGERASQLHLIADFIVHRTF